MQFVNEIRMSFKVVKGIHEGNFAIARNSQQWSTLSISLRKQTVHFIIAILRTSLKLRHFVIHLRQLRFCSSSLCHVDYSCVQVNQFSFHSMHNSQTVFPFDCHSVVSLCRWKPFIKNEKERGIKIKNERKKERIFELNNSQSHWYIMAYESADVGHRPLYAAIPGTDHRM